MMKAVPSITPQSGYLVTTAAGDFQLNQPVLATLYQPLMSPDAYVLETILAAQLVERPTLVDRQRHSTLLTLLNTGVGKLEAARDQLEALGLLRTFFQDDAVGTVFVYQLQPILSAQQFFNEDLLSTRLLQMVGEERFKQLAAAAHRYYYDPGKLQETTHHFFDVFTPDNAAVDNDHQLVGAVKEELRTDSRSEELPEDNFDFALLAKQLESDGLDPADIQQQRSLIITQHLMYGIDEPRMRQLVLKAVDWGISNKIDSRQLKLVVAGEFQSPVSQPAVTSPATAPVDNPAGLSEQEMQLVKVAAQMAPITFLATLKEQTGGGFVTSSEKYIISNLLNQGMTPEVVNILSYDVIVQQDLPTLRKNLVDTIANSWQRSKIDTAAAALKEIANFHRPQKTKTAHRYRKRGGRVKEQLPEWAQTAGKKKQTKATAAQLRESQQLLAKLKQKHDNKG